MAREYPQDNGDGTVSVIRQNDDGTYTVIGGPYPINAPPASTPPPGGPGVGQSGGGQQYVGGGGQTSGYNDAAQLQLLLKRLQELEIPGLDVERRRQLLAEIQSISSLTGYINPGLWQGLLGAYGQGTGLGGTTGGTPLTDDSALDYIWQKRPDLAGFYKNNGWQTDTVDQQRAIVRNWISKGDPQWAGKTAQDVAKALGYSGGTDGTGGGGSSQQGSSLRQQMIEWDQAFHEVNQGRAPTRDERVAYLMKISGMTQQQASAMEDRRDQYVEFFGRNKQGWDAYYPPDAEYGSWQQQIAPQQTLARDQFDELKRQFDAEQKTKEQQFWGGLLASKSGPRDYWTYNAMQASIPENVKWGDMASLANNTAAFGAMTPGNNSWEQTFYNWMQKQKGGTAPATGGQPPVSGGGIRPGGTPYTQSGLPNEKAFVQPASQGGPIGGEQPKPNPSLTLFEGGPIGAPGTTETWSANNGSYSMPANRDTTDWRGVFQQPNQLGPRTYNRMSPSQKEMRSGQWSSFEVNPDDAWDKMRRSWQGGQANRQTVWR